MRVHKDFAALSLALIGAILLLLTIGFLIEKEKRNNLINEIKIIQQIEQPQNNTIDPKDYGVLCTDAYPCTESITAVYCMPEVDGPIIYVDNDTKEIIATCSFECSGDGCEREKCLELFALCP